MAYPGYSVYPGYTLYPGEGEDLTVRQTAALPPETLEELLSGSRSVLARVEVEHEGVLLDLPVTGGTVKESWDATPRTTATIEVAKLSDLMPSSRASILDPRSGARFHISFTVSGPRTPGATFNYGRFVATSISVGTGELRLDLADFSHLIRARLMTAPTVVRPGLNPLEQVGRLLAYVATPRDGSTTPSSASASWVRIAGGATDLPPTAEYLVGAVGGDPWAACQTVAKAAGAMLYFNEEGLLQMPRITDPLVSPITAHWETGPDSVLASVDRSVDNTDAPEAIIVKWAGGVEIVPGDTGGRLALWSGDPATIDSSATARAAGEADLAIRRGAVEKVSVSAWPRYGLHAGDVVRVFDAASGTDTVARVTDLTVPLNGGPMSITLADRRLSS